MLRSRNLLWLRFKGLDLKPAFPILFLAPSSRLRAPRLPQRTDNCLPRYSPALRDEGGLTDPPRDGLIRSQPALSPSPLGLYDLCRGYPARSIRGVRRLDGLAAARRITNEALART